MRFRLNVSRCTILITLLILEPKEKTPEGKPKAPEGN